MIINNIFLLQFQAILRLIFQKLPVPVVNQYMGLQRRHPLADLGSWQ